MSRVSALPFDQVPANLQAVMQQYDDELGGSAFVKVFAHAPELYQKFIDFYFPLALEARGAVDMKVTELARLMVAKKNDCNLWMYARLAVARHEGLTESHIAELDNYESSSLLTAREKIAIRFAEVLAGDHKTASEDLFDKLREHFTEAEIIDLGWRIVTFVGYGRFIHVLGLEIGDPCPISKGAESTS